MSLLTFALFFLNVLFGGPLERKPFMSDVAEMLVLFAAVILFVTGALVREAQAKATEAGAGRSNDSENRTPKDTSTSAPG